MPTKTESESLASLRTRGNGDIPIGAIEQCRTELERLVESNLPVSEYANQLLALLDTEEEGG